MARIRIPCSLREHCGGHSEVEVDSADLAAALEELETRYPDCRERITDGTGHLREFVRLFVNEREVSVEGGTAVALRPGDAISILPAVCGG